MQATNIDNPLTNTHYNDISRGLNILAQVMRKIELAEQAGNDMTDYRTSHDLLRKRLMQTKAVYFPDRP